MKVAITGATGFIGRELLKQLAYEKDYSITALTRTLERQKRLEELPNVHWLKGDLSSDTVCKHLVVHQDVVVHLAHTNSPLTSDKDIVSDAALNLSPTLTLLKAIESEGRALHFVYASSGGAIYGEPTNAVPFKESYPCLPGNSYGIQKLAVEHYLRIFSERGILSANALRMANAYGQVVIPERLQGLIGTVVYHILKGDSIHVIGNPDNVRDYLHVDDIVQAIKASMIYRNEFEIFNIGSGIGYSVKQVIDLTETILGRPIRRIHNGAAVGRYLPNWCVLNVERARAKLNWTPKIDLKTGLTRLMKEVGLIHT